MKIISNYHWRQFEYFCDLSYKDKQELDWIKDYTATVFHYRGNIYSLDEFMRVEKKSSEDFAYWDGYLGDSFFSGILIKISEDDTDYYQIASFSILKG